MSNAFEIYAEDTKPNWRAKQERTTQKRRETLAAKKSALEQQREDEATLLRNFKASERAEEQRLLDGQHGKDVAGLRQFLRTMTLESAPALLRIVERAEWIGTLSFEDRTALTGMVSRGITRLRKRNGLTPFDDPMPFTDQPPSAYDLIKAEICSEGRQ